jgi:hypothetical protein
MNKSDFFKNFLDYSKREGFSFFISGEQFNDPEKLSSSRQMMNKLMFAAAVGIGGAIGGAPASGLGLSIAILNPGDLNPVERQALISDLEIVHNHCDFIGIKISNGPALLRLGIDADDISDESLIGRFAIRHEQAYKFRKHSSSLFRNRVSKNVATFAVYAQIVVVFSTHKRARNFIQNSANKCSHSAFWQKVYTSPWIVDLEDEDIKRYRQPLDGFLGYGEKLKVELFQK